MLKCCDVSQTHCLYFYSSLQGILSFLFLPGRAPKIYQMKKIQHWTSTWGYEHMPLSLLLTHVFEIWPRGIKDLSNTEMSGGVPFLALLLGSILPTSLPVCTGCNVWLVNNVSVSNMSMNNDDCQGKIFILLIMLTPQQQHAWWLSNDLPDLPGGNNSLLLDSEVTCML